MIEQSGMNFLRDCGGSGCDEAVNDDRDFQSSAAEAYAGHRGDLETAEPGQHRVARRRPVAMDLERARDHFDFAADAGIVEAGAAADYRLGWDCGERTEERGGGRAVRDAHLADTDQRRAVACQLACDFDSYFERAHRFV